MAGTDKVYLVKRRDVTSAAIVVSHIIAVVGPVYAAAALGPGWHTIAFWLVFGLSMNGLLNLMHECAHGHVFRDPRGSDVLGRFVLAPLVFADFDTYRARHWDHHRFVGRDGETKDTYLIDIKGAALFRAFVRCASMKEAAAKFLKQERGERSSARTGRWLVRLAVFQVLFGLSLVACAKAANETLAWDRALFFAFVAYAGVYLYGLMSLTVFMASLRAIAEHQQYGDGAEEKGYAALRNFACTPLSRYLMGAYGFGEHSTHHRVPAIPYYRLKKATRAWSRTDPSLEPKKDYFRVLFEIATR